MTTANIPVYGHIALYIKYYMSVLKGLYTNMLKIHLFSVFTIKTPRALAAVAPLDLLISKTLTHLL